MKLPSLSSIMGPIIPKNTFQIWLEKAKSYTDSKLGTSEGNLNELTTRVSELASRVRFLEATTQTKEGTTAVEAKPGQAVTVSDPETEAYVRGSIDQTASLLAKSVTVDGLAFAPAKITKNSNGMYVKSPTVSISESDMVGCTQDSSNLFKAVDTQDLVIKDTVFTGATYNTIMTGQNCTEYIKSLLIENCTFDEDCKHVSIWLASFQDGATITIRNCKFKSCEHILCLSDMAGKTNKCKIVLENITIDKYDDEPDAYRGIMYCDDRICKSEEEFLESNPFANIELELNNVTAMGTPVTPSNFILGTMDEKQMMYVYCAKARKTYSDVSVFPKITVNGTAIN